MSIVLRPQELERDVEEQDAADGLQVWNTQQDGGQRGKEDAESDSTGAAEDNRPAAILRGEAARRHPDDDGIVPRKHEVDDDDAEDCC
jgi:hypothetical protein